MSFYGSTGVLQVRDLGSADWYYEPSLGSK